DPAMPVPLEPRLPELFDTHPLPMWVFDTETLHFLAVNTAAVAHYGYTEDEFLGMSLGDVRPAEDVPLLREVVSGIRNVPLYHAGRWRHRKKDGTPIVVEVTAHAVTFRGRPARLAINMDVTERVRTEAEREKLIHKLED